MTSHHGDQAEDYGYTGDNHTGDQHHHTSGGHQHTNGGHQHTTGGHHHANATTTPQPVVQRIACWGCGYCGFTNVWDTNPACINVLSDGYICGHAYCPEDCVVEWRDVVVEGTGSRHSGSSARRAGAGAGAGPSSGSSSSSSRKGPKGGSSSRRSGAARGEGTTRA